MKRYLLWLLLLGGTVQARAQVYVNGTTGTDAVGGNHSTLNNPYRTIQFGISNVLTGQAVVVQAGFYALATPLSITRTMTLQGQGRVVVDGTSVAPPSAGAYRYLLRIAGASGVTVQDLTLQNCTDNGAKGIWITEGAGNVTIQRCTVQNVGWRSNDLTTLPPTAAPVPSASAIKVEGTSSVAMSGIRILSDSVRNCATGYGEAIVVNGNVDQFVIDHNVVSRIANIGIDVAGNYGSDFPAVPAALNRARNGLISYNQVSECMSGRAPAAGIYLDGALNCTVVGNVCTRNGVGIAAGSERAPAAGGKLSRQHRVVSNQLTSNVLWGMLLGAFESGTAPMHPVKQLEVANNTLWGNRTGNVINGITQLDNGAGVITPLPAATENAGGEVGLLALDSVQFRNNIVVPRDAKPALVGLYDYAVQHFASNYNCYYSPMGATLFQIGCIPFNALTNRFPAASVADFNTITTLDGASISLAGNPGLVSPASNDFSLSSSSTLINRGDPQAPASGALALDCGGHPRVVGGRIDLGAYEYQAVLATSAAATAGRSSYPNPTTGLLWLSGDRPRLLVLRNYLGAVVATYNAPAAAIDLAGLPPGLYLLEATPPRGAPYTERVILR